MRVSRVILASGNMTLPPCNKSHHCTLQQSIFAYCSIGWSIKLECSPSLKQMLLQLWDNEGTLNIHCNVPQLVLRWWIQCKWSKQAQLMLTNPRDAFRDQSKSVKITKHGTIRYGRYGFPLVCYSNFVPKRHCFSDIRLVTMHWPWNPG